MYVVKEVQETLLSDLREIHYFSSLVPLLEQPGTGSDTAVHVSATGLSGSLQI